jgi:hypothetical protein
MAEGEEGVLEVEAVGAVKEEAVPAVHKEVVLQEEVVPAVHEEAEVEDAEVLELRLQQIFVIIDRDHARINELFA